MKMCLAAPIVLLVVLETAATGATIVIPVNSGSISFQQTSLQGYFQPTFNLQGPTGSLTGSTPTVAVSLSSATAIPVSAGTKVIDPTLNFYTGTAYSGFGGITDFQLQVPDAVHIYNNGAPPYFDQVSGSLTVAPLVLLDDSSTPLQPISLLVPFSGELRMTDHPLGSPALLNEYVFSGQGVAQLNFNWGCKGDGTCLAEFENATYTFTPEPATASLLLLTSLLGGAWFLRYRHSQVH